MKKKIDWKWSLRLHEAGDDILPVWKFLSMYGIFLYLAFFAGLFIASIQRERLIILTVFSLGITASITLIARYIIKRPRPKHMETGYIPWLNDYGFPSGHASIAFAIAALESWLFLTPVITTAGIVLTSIAITVACLIAVSRVVLGVHYIGDVVAGAFLGTMVSATIIYIL